MGNLEEIAADGLHGQAVLTENIMIPPAQN